MHGELLKHSAIGYVINFCLEWTTDHIF